MKLQYLIKLGMSLMDVIVSATSVGSLTLGARAPKSGQITAGLTDLTLLKENPSTKLQASL